MHGFLGIDVGSVSTNLVVLDQQLNVISQVYLRTQGQPIPAVQNGLRQIRATLPQDFTILGVGTTGSGRLLAGVIAGGDVIKNEITAHAVAAIQYCPDVQTVIEIGGQDSKIIIIRQGIVTDFAMNTVCAAGTGSFLDQQANRLNIPISEFGAYALRAVSPVRIAGRCTVFAESDMIHKQQTGHNLPEIIAGLCTALVRNYLNNVGKGKDIKPPIMFQGGVAANLGIRSAFTEAFGQEVIIPPHFDVMGAIGAAILAARQWEQTGIKTRFKGFGVCEQDFRTTSFDCQGCANCCEIISISVDNELAARWGGRCDKWNCSLIG